MSNNGNSNNYSQAPSFSGSDSTYSSAQSGSSGQSSGEKGYEITGSGTNTQGNHWCSRDYGPNAPNDNSYHYSNKDGSYYYNNPNGSTYYNDGKGNSTYRR